MKLLDLFCGAGGCAKGYSDAGFDEIIGVDQQPQPRYPYKFIQHDALDYLNECDLRGFDLVHASPPCQLFTFGNVGRETDHLDLITPIRQALLDRHIEYVIENVPGSPLIKGQYIYLEGLMFGLHVTRRRHFETNWPLHQPCKVHTQLRADRHELSTVAGHGGNGVHNLFTWSLAMGITWMNKEEIIQAIPPKYTEYIGKEFIEYLELG